MSTAMRIPPPQTTGVHWYGTPIDEAIDAFSATAVRASTLDPITTEVVRLRCARYHDCRLCQSLRVDTALAEGLDEQLAAKVDVYETSDLDERLKVALRLTDAVIVDPSCVDAALAAQLHEHFSEAQIAELMHDIVKWSFQKVLVALRLDVPVRDGLSVLSFDAHGDPSIGDPIAS
jgi:alkylhydroperoxidase family enzyme